MKTYIYAIKNLVNNKVYIGSTKSIKRRQHEHFYHLKKQTHHSYHLQQSYNKYGKDKFAFYILEECSIDNRKEKEIYYIESYKCYKREFGYNVYEPDSNNFKCSEETRFKIQNTDYIKDKRVSVDAYTTEGVFKGNFVSLADCAKEFGIPNCIVGQILNNKGRKSFKGLTFTFEREPFTYQTSVMKRDMQRFYK